MKKSIIFFVALYIRLSREDGDKEESDSVANQRKLLMEYIDGKEEFVLIDIYIDDGFSGTNFNRPDFKRMLEDIEQKKINCVIVKDLSRFGRDYIDTGRYLERIFPEKGVRFISLSDGIDSMKQAYDLMLPIKNIFNEQYARDISKKIQATIKMKQYAGEFIGSFASYGYKKDPNNKNKLVIDEYPAMVVKRIFEMYISGIGKQKIARILTDEGIPCPSAYKQLNGDRYRNFNYNRDNGYWTYSTVDSILHKEIYIGNMVQHTRHQNMQKKQDKVDEEDWIVVAQTHEPIISQEMWEKTQNLLKRRTRQLDLVTNQNIFAGYVRCGDCGAAMAKVSWKRKDGTTTESFYCGTYKRLGNKYCTPHTMPMKVLEKIVIDDLNTIIGQIENLDSLAKSKPAMPDKNSLERMKSQIDKLKCELNKIRKYKQSLYEDYKDGIVSKEEYTEYREDYMQKETILQKQIKTLESSQETGEQSVLNTPWVTKLLQMKMIENLDRSIIVEMIDQIVVYNNRKIRIVYNFSDELKDLFNDRFEMRN